jgi:hypothetical protein
MENKQVRGAVGVVLREFLVGKCGGCVGDVFDASGA